MSRLLWNLIFPISGFIIYCFDTIWYDWNQISYHFFIFTPHCFGCVRRRPCPILPPCPSAPVLCRVADGLLPSMPSLTFMTTIHSLCVNNILFVGGHSRWNTILAFQNSLFPPIYSATFHCNHHNRNQQNPRRSQKQILWVEFWKWLSEFLAQLFYSHWTPRYFFLLPQTKWFLTVYRISQEVGWDLCGILWTNLPRQSLTWGGHRPVIRGWTRFDDLQWHTTWRGIYNSVEIFPKTCMRAIRPHSFFWISKTRGSYDNDSFLNIEEIWKILANPPTNQQGLTPEK